MLTKQARPGHLLPNHGRSYMIRENAELWVQNVRYVPLAKANLMMPVDDQNRIVELPSIITPTEHQLTIRSTYPSGEALPENVAQERQIPRTHIFKHVSTSFVTNQLGQRADHDMCAYVQEVPAYTAPGEVAPRRRREPKEEVRSTDCNMARTNCPTSSANWESSISYRL